MAAALQMRSSFLGGAQGGCPGAGSLVRVPREAPPAPAPVGEALLNSGRPVAADLQTPLSFPFVKSMRGASLPSMPSWVLRVGGTPDFAHSMQCGAVHAFA